MIFFTKTYFKTSTSLSRIKNFNMHKNRIFITLQSNEESNELSIKKCENNVILQQSSCY